MRKLLSVLLCLLFLSVGAISLEFPIMDECSGEYSEELFSISNITNAHAAEPDVFKDYYEASNNREGKIVCAPSELETNIDNECEALKNPIFSFYNPGTGRSHLSPEGEKNEYVLCTRELSTSVRRSCPGGSEPIISIYDPIENHVAEPGYYEWQVCGQLFKNASLAYNFTMEGNTDFIQDGKIIDNEETVNKSSTTEEDSYPLYSVVQNNSLISGVVGSSTHPQKTSIQLLNDITNIEHSYERSHNLRWFIPFTTGTYFDIEDRLSLIADNNFLTQFNPNFAFFLAEEILVRITLNVVNADIVNDLELGSGVHNLIIRNVGEEHEMSQVEINVSEE